MRTLFSTLLCLFLAMPCWAGETLNSILARKTIRCGVSPDIPGFALHDAQGQWSGMDVDFCRAMAAAVLQTPDKVSFVPLPTRARFSSLLSKEIDLLSRNTSQTIGRESQLGVLFAGPLFITGQAFLVRSEDAGKGLKGLDNATIAVIKGSTHVHNLDYVAAKNNLRFHPVLFDGLELAARAFLDGQCAALTNDATVLAAVRLLAPKGEQSLTLLPGLHSREIISPVVRQDDIPWLLTVRAVLSALVTAEELGLTSATLQAASITPATGDIRVFLDRTDTLAASLGLTPGWAGRAIAAVGNYGEMLERNLGKNGPLKLERGPNRLVRDGGMIYAVPF